MVRSTPQFVPRDATPAPTPVHAFWQGFAAPLHGFRFLRHHPKLWPYAILPMLLTLILSLLTLAAIVVGSAWLIGWLNPQFPEGWYWAIAEIAADIAVILVVVVLAIVAYLLLNALVCEFFRSVLAEKVEQELGFREEDIHKVGLLRIVIDACNDVLFLVVVNIGLLFLHIVPVVGSAAAVVGSLYFECITFGEDYLAYPIEFRGLRRKDRREWIKSHRGHALGLGAITFPSTFIPILSSIVLTGAAVGAVLLYRRVEAADACEQPRLKTQPATC